jgi:hypothetical protein
MNAHEILEFCCKCLNHNETFTCGATMCSKGHRTPCEACADCKLPLDALHKNFNYCEDYIEK